MIVSLAIFTAILLVGLTKVDPRTAEWLGFVGVTTALLIFLWSLIGTLLLSHRVWRRKNKPVAVSLRQASFLSILVVAALYLQRFELLTWWNVVLLIGIAVLLEIFFVGREEIQL